MMRRLAQWITMALTLTVLAFVGGSLFYGTKTMHELLGNNQKLKAALTTLMHEDQIGYAKVIHQEMRGETLFTTLRFVEIARDHPQQILFEKEFEIEGDVAHFDALIVSFSDQAVLDKTAHALYLWRRIYGEHQTPDTGFPIETPSTNPERYANLLHELNQPEQQMFWEAIWNLANNPKSLQDYGIKAIYGNAVYIPLRPGIIYTFKIGADGQIYPQTTPDL